MNSNFFSKCLVLGAVKENGEIASLIVNEDCDQVNYYLYKK